MAEFRRVAITEQGLNMISRVMNNEIEIIFTKMCTGDGVYTDEELETLRECKNLKSEKQQTEFSSKEVVNNNVMKLLAYVSNSELQQGYYIREVGIYAKESDDAVEVLYGIAVAAEDRTDYLPNYNGVSPNVIQEEFHIAVGNVENCKVEFSSFVFVTQEEFREHKEQTIVETDINILESNWIFDENLEKYSYKYVIINLTSKDLPTVWYTDIEKASECGISAESTDGGILFTCDEVPSCTIECSVEVIKVES